MVGKESIRPPLMVRSPDPALTLRRLRSMLRTRMRLQPWIGSKVVLKLSVKYLNQPIRERFTLEMIAAEPHPLVRLVRPRRLSLIFFRLFSRGH
jgi:hypothetical protein